MYIFISLCTLDDTLHTFYKYQNKNWRKKSLLWDRFELGSPPWQAATLRCHYVTLHMSKTIAPVLFISTRFLFSKTQYREFYHRNPLTSHTVLRFFLKIQLDISKVFIELYSYKRCTTKKTSSLKCCDYHYVTKNVERDLKQNMMSKCVEVVFYFCKHYEIVFG